MGYSPWAYKRVGHNLATKITESICTGEDNGTPLQYSCLGNPMDGGAWWAAVHGVAKSQIRLSDFTFTFHFPLSCAGEGDGNPLQYSCLENPRDGEACWAAVYGVAQSRTRLKQLSSSSSSSSRSTLSAGTRGKTYGKETGTKKNNCLIGFSSSDCLG